MFDEDAVPRLAGLIFGRIGLALEQLKSSSAAGAAVERPPAELARYR